MTGIQHLALDIEGVYLGNKLISKVCFWSYDDKNELKEYIIWQNIKGSAGSDVSYDYNRGVLRFSGTGSLDKIEGDILDANNAKNVKEIIVEDTITEIAEGVFGPFYNLEKITLPFVGKNIKNEYYVYPFGYIFGEKMTQNYYEVNSFLDQFQTNTQKDVPNFYWDSETSKYVLSNPYNYQLPLSLKTVIVTGGQGDNFHICRNCFFLCKELQNIIFSSSKIYSFGVYCLHGCEQLINLTVPFVGQEPLSNLQVNSTRNCNTIYSLLGTIRIGTTYGKPGWFIDTNKYYLNICRSGVNTGASIINESTNSWSSWVYIPKTLKNLTVLGGDIPKFAFYLEPSSASNPIPVLFNFEKIKLSSKNNYPPIEYIHAFALPLSIKLTYTNLLRDTMIFIPKSLLGIGWDEFSPAASSSHIYYEGNQDQWNTLSIKYKNSIDSQNNFFDRWKENTTCNYSEKQFDLLKKD